MGKGDPKGGRPEFELSDDDFGKIVGMMRIQCTEVEICSIIGVTDKTLNKALNARGEPGFSELYKRYQDEGKASLRRSQWKVAQEGNPTMLIWLGKQMLGQRDRKDLDLSSRDGSMSNIPPDASADDLRKVRELLYGKPADKD